MHQWKKALNIYEKNLNSEQPTLAHLLPGGASSYLVSEPSTVTESKLEMLMGRMRCLKGLGEWQKLNVSANNLLGLLTNKNQNALVSLNNQKVSYLPQTSTTDDSFNPEVIPRIRSVLSSIQNATSPNLRNHQRQASITSPSTSNIGNCLFFIIFF